MTELMSFDTKELVNNIVNNQANTGALAVYMLLQKRHQRYKHDRKIKISLFSDKELHKSLVID